MEHHFPIISMCSSDVMKCIFNVLECITPVVFSSWELSTRQISTVKRAVLQFAPTVNKL